MQRSGHVSTTYASSTQIRSMFSQALSDLYRKEVPLYGELMELISEVNAKTLRENRILRSSMIESGQLQRLHLERHGAIRLGSAAEMAVMARFLKIMGMNPVGYYDLAPAGLPIHATCFRTLDAESLSQNPFRLFVSLIRPSLVPEPLRTNAFDLLSRRKIFLPRIENLIGLAEKNDLRMTYEEASEFITLGLETFKWHSRSVLTVDEYRYFDGVSPLLADVVGFHGPHINHLTPRTLDIDQAQRTMISRGFPVKSMIEGPPRRNCPILLRQTSFQALDEPISFPSRDGTTIAGVHAARFGEVEERGVALTPVGRRLYDEIIQECRAKGVSASDTEQYAASFARFPDEWDTLRKSGLAWFRFHIAAKDRWNGLPQICPGWIENFEESLEYLIELGWIKFEPIVYEDFLPLSAAGIFQSNLKENANATEHFTEVVDDASKELRDALQVCIEDEMANYAMIQEQSLSKCRTILSSLAHS